MDGSSISPGAWLRPRRPVATTLTLAATGLALLFIFAVTLGATTP